MKMLLLALFLIIAMLTGGGGWAFAMNEGHNQRDEIPFKFEDYKTKEEFQGALERYFPQGEDAHKMSEILLAAGAERRVAETGAWVFTYKKTVIPFIAYKHWGVNVVVSEKEKIKSVLAFYSIVGI